MLEFNTEIIKLISEYSGINEKLFSEACDRIKNGFNEDFKDSHSGFQFLEKGIVQFNEETLAAYNKATLIGLDVPALVKGKAAKKTIMIIGIDPLRKKRDFPEDVHGKVITGTPYAIHSKFYRESAGRTKVYWDLIKWLLENEYNVYLTDINKFWFSTDGDAKKKYDLKSEYKNNISLLEKECSNINPLYIVAFGDFVTSFCENKKIREFMKGQIISLPHPSGANRNWNTIIKTSPRSAKEKVEKLIEELKKKI
jgi:hypothetical protein